MDQYLQPPYLRGETFNRNCCVIIIKYWSFYYTDTSYTHVTDFKIG